MTTGSVNPFTPTQPTQVATPGAAANSLMSFNQCDALLIYNSGTVLVFVGFATATNPYAATPIVSGGVPIPAGAQVLLGVPGVIGNNSDPVNQIALLSATGTAGNIYV